jgi:hypothetical protein
VLGALSFSRRLPWFAAFMLFEGVRETGTCYLGFVSSDAYATFVRWTLAPALVLLAAAVVECALGILRRCGCWWFVAGVGLLASVAASLSPYGAPTALCALAVAVLAALLTLRCTRHALLMLAWCSAGLVYRVCLVYGATAHDDPRIWLIWAQCACVCCG